MNCRCSTRRPEDVVCWMGSTWQSYERSNKLGKTDELWSNTEKYSRCLLLCGLGCCSCSALNDYCRASTRLRDSYKQTLANGKIFLMSSQMSIRNWEKVCILFHIGEESEFALFLGECPCQATIHDPRFIFTLCPEKTLYSSRNAEENNNCTTTRKEYIDIYACK